MRHFSIHRLELQVAVLAVRFEEEIVKEHDVDTQLQYMTGLNSSTLMDI